MSKVRASCPIHGDVETTIETMEIVIDKKTGFSMYRYKCPEDGDTVYKNELLDSTAKLLISAGCVVSYVDAPVIDTREMPPITIDDQLKAHEILQGTVGDSALHYFFRPD